MTTHKDPSALGELVSSHRNTRRSRILLLTVGLVCVLGGAFLAIAPWAFPDPNFGTLSSIVTGVIAAGIVFLGFLLLRRLVTSRGRVVELFQHGLVDRLRSGTTVAPFDEVESIQSQRLQLIGAYGAVRTKSESHILRLRQGDTVKLDHFLQGMNTLGTRLEEQVAQCMLPHLRRQLAEGASVSFGPATLTQEQISTGGQAVSYAELAGVSVQVGWVSLFKHGHPGAWRRVRYGSLLNALSFLTLVRERIKKA